MNVPFLDLKSQYQSIKSEIDNAIQKVVNHGLFVMGPELGELEEKIAQYCGVRHGVGVASGTDALLLSLRALGIGPADEVVTTSFSFFATAGVITRLGARPVFVDIDEDSFNMNPDSLSKAISKNTKAIMPVHLMVRLPIWDQLWKLPKNMKFPSSKTLLRLSAQSIKARRQVILERLPVFRFSRPKIWEPMVTRD